MAIHIEGLGGGSVSQSWVMFVFCCLFFGFCPFMIVYCCRTPLLDYDCSGVCEIICVIGAVLMNVPRETLAIKAVCTIGVPGIIQ